jgi:2-aminoethylphosphonate-pyruvate transaminase
VPLGIENLKNSLETDASISHVAAVHCETTTGMLNPISEIGEVVKKHGKVFIVDAMSSFGGIPMNQQEIGADYLISSANKCIQGVPGFGFIIAVRDELRRTKGRARSHSLDLYDQWLVMEEKNGKWRFTSPTHVVRAFAQALQELDDEGGIVHRYQRYSSNQRMLVRGMEDLGFRCLLPLKDQSPIITSFLSPVHPDYVFATFYEELKKRGFVIYPGKVSDHESFRIGTIGDVMDDDVQRLLQAIRESCYWK